MPPSRPAAELLMCRPAFYTIAYEINPWMRLSRQADRTRAAAQWQQLYTVLRRDVKARVRLLSPQRGVPDLVFTANAGLVRGRLFIRSNFRFPQRRKEEPVVERYFRRAGFRVATLPSSFRFEGEGDALWAGSRLIFGFRFRSDAPAHAELARLLNAEVLPVELTDGRFYHLDTCFAPLGRGRALWYPKAFDRYGRVVIERATPDAIAVSARDAARFACNAVVVDQHIVVPAGVSPALRRALTRRGFEVHAVDLSEFLKAGGSAKCLVLHLTPPASSMET
jgi:N-dimethylarginine dimethylaminohydrolase